MRSGCRPTLKMICAIRLRTTSEQGVLKPAADGEVKYSWRGMIYLWCQFLLDLVRL